MNEEDLTDSYSQEANENMKVAIEKLRTERNKLLQETDYE